jgi:hypothetical protein
VSEAASAAGQAIVKSPATVSVRAVRVAIAMITSSAQFWTTLFFPSTPGTAAGDTAGSGWWDIPVVMIFMSERPRSNSRRTGKLQASVERFFRQLP